MGGSHGETLLLAVAARQTEVPAAEVARQRLARVYRAEHALLRCETADGFAAALKQLVRSVQEFRCRRERSLKVGIAAGISGAVQHPLASRDRRAVGRSMRISTALSGRSKGFEQLKTAPVGDISRAKPST